MTQLVERANQVQEVVGSVPDQHTFSPEKQITKIFCYYTISHRKSTGKWR